MELNMNIKDKTENVLDDILETYKIVNNLALKKASIFLPDLTRYNHRELLCSPFISPYEQYKNNRIIKVIYLNKTNSNKTGFKRKIEYCYLRGYEVDNFMLQIKKYNKKVRYFQKKYAEEHFPNKMIRLLYLKACAPGKNLGICDAEILTT